MAGCMIEPLTLCLSLPSCLKISLSLYLSLSLSVNISLLMSKGCLFAYLTVGLTALCVHVCKCLSVLFLFLSLSLQPRLCWSLIFYVINSLTQVPSGCLVSINFLPDNLVLQQLKNPKMSTMQSKYRALSCYSILILYRHLPSYLPFSNPCFYISQVHLFVS